MDAPNHSSDKANSAETLLATDSNSTIILRSYDSGESHSIIGNMVIGRESDCGICLNYKKISRYHAKVHIASNGLFISDLQSSNGTFVNGKRVTSPVLIEVGDEIQFGDQRYRLTTVSNTVDNDATLLSEPSLVNSALLPPKEEPPYQPDAMPSVPDTSEQQPDSTRLLNPELLRTVAKRNSASPHRLSLGSGPRLIVNTAPIRGQIFSLLQENNAPITIGRDEGNDIVLPDQSVSRQHATITADEEGFLIQTFSPANGLLVNSFNVQQWRLQEGDSMQLGRIELIFKASATASSRTTLQKATTNKSSPLPKYLLIGSIALAGVILAIAPWLL